MDWKKQLPPATPKGPKQCKPVEYDEVELEEEEASVAEKLEYEKLREQYNKDCMEESLEPAPSKKERVRFEDDDMENVDDSLLKENIGPSCDGEKLKKSPIPPPKANVLRERQPEFEKIMPAPRKFSCVSIAFSEKPSLPDHLPARESRGNMHEFVSLTCDYTFPCSCCCLCRSESAAERSS